MTEELLNFVGKLKFVIIDDCIGHSTFDEVILHICEIFYEDVVYNITKIDYVINIERHFSGDIKIIASSLSDGLYKPELPIYSEDITCYIKQYRRCLNISKL